MALTEKQETFIREYLVDLNATQAAIRAGYSEKTAAEIGRQNLIKLENEIQSAMVERSRRTEITADKVLRELAHIAFDDIKNYLRFYPDSEGNIKMEIKDSSTIDTRSISEVSIGKDGQFKFKMYCKDNALVQLGRHLGMFNDKLEHSGAITHEHKHNLKKLSPKELADLEHILTKTADTG